MKPKNRKNVKIHYPKCYATKKSMFETEADALRVKMRIWSHDTKADIRDLHAYVCPECAKWHIGHRSYYEIVQKRVSESNQPSAPVVG